ncbi:MAG TPA: CRISPR-associated helicase Cas3' [Alphaproteobacteria bacterium]|nr:CRISPR-associated helicase Cas3' [Alphaproteobacteria bacterium]
MDATAFYRELLHIDQPHAHQRTLFELLSTDPAPATLLRAPCGSGKTEAAVAPFLHQFVTHDFVLAPRLIYVLPTRALCDTLAQRLARYAAAVHPRLVVEAHHGAHPAEPFFFSDVVVTTLDQFIYAYARAASHLGSAGVGRHLDLPAGAIANAFVVFDEAHMYEPYSHALMRAMVELLFEARVPFLFMTATMPQALLADYSERTSFTRIDYQAPSSATPPRQLSLEVYEEPLLSGAEAGAPPATLHPYAADLLASHRRCLVVVNTVGRAQAAYQAIRALRDDAMLIHARFTAADRHRLESAVAAGLGRAGPGGVVVSTQVCEAGLDITADLLVTELAPADALVQRAGRCARFGGAGRMLVFGADAAPYEPLSLEITRDHLRQHPSLQLADWQATTAFVDRLPYRVEDLLANDSLHDLYEATLFADARPQRLSVRDGKPLYLWVKEEGERPDPATLHDHLLSIDIRQAGRLRALLDQEKVRLLWLQRHDDGSLREEPARDASQVQPFRTYVLPRRLYDPKLGVVWP